MTPAVKPRSLTAQRKAAKDCRRCPLWRRATQVVYGAGNSRAALLIVGEQPGDAEDRQGHPFVGPAGRELRAALEAAGVPNDAIYVTNAVKHFKWTERGKRRIHERPNRDEILACRMWLEEEIRTVRPRLLLALGVTAATALLGRVVAIGRSRGMNLEGPDRIPVRVTTHPSAILRMPDEGARAEARAALIDDLRAAFASSQP
jgi:uracil-DNA glycosylase